MAGIFDPLISVAQTPIGTIFLLGLVGIGVYYIVTRYLMSDKEDTFEIETFEDVVSKDLDEKFNLKGIKTSSALVQGFDYLGSVDRWLRERGKQPVMKYDDVKGKFITDQDKEKMQEYDLYIFRIWNTNFIYKFFGFGKKKYVMCDKKHISNIDTKKPNMHQWNIKPNIQFFRWGDVFVTSAIGEDFVSDIAIKRSHENTMTFLMNYARKVIYLEMKHTQMIDRYATKKRIDSKSWESYKKAEEIEDEDYD